MRRTPIACLLAEGGGKWIPWKARYRVNSWYSPIPGKRRAPWQRFTGAPIRVYADRRIQDDIAKLYTGRVTRERVSKAVMRRIMRELR